MEFADDSGQTFGEVLSGGGGMTENAAEAEGNPFPGGPMAGFDFSDAPEQHFDQEFLQEAFGGTGWVVFDFGHQTCHHSKLETSWELMGFLYL